MQPLSFLKGLLSYIFKYLTHSLLHFSHQRLHLFIIGRPLYSSTLFSPIFPCCCFETSSHSLQQVGLKHAIVNQTGLELLATLLHWLPKFEITCICNHALILWSLYFLISASMNLLYSCLSSIFLLIIYYDVYNQMCLLCFPFHSPFISLILSFFF